MKRAWITTVLSSVALFGLFSSATEAQFVGANFTASTESVDTPDFVPDAMGAVGVDHFVELINGRYSVYRKSDGSRVQTSTADTFWVNSGATPSFNGETVVNTDVLVKYTYYGDSDFTGEVDFDDYVQIDGGFNAELSGWFNGDFNLDDEIDFDDYVLIDNAFNTQTAPRFGFEHDPLRLKWLGQSWHFQNLDSYMDYFIRWNLKYRDVQYTESDFDPTGLPGDFGTYVPEPGTLVAVVLLLCRGRNRRSAPAKALV